MPEWVTHCMFLKSSKEKQKLVAHSFIHTGKTDEHTTEHVNTKKHGKRSELMRLTVSLVMHTVKKENLVLQNDTSLLTVLL